MKKVNYIFYLFVAFMAISMLACKSDPKPAAKPKVTTTKPKASTKKPKASKKKNVSTNDDYHSKLKAALKLKNKQVRELKAIEAKFTKQLRVTRKAGKLNKEARRNITLQKNEAIKKYLGSTLYKKKVNFDRRQRKLKTANKRK